MLRPKYVEHSLVYAIYLLLSVLHLIGGVSIASSRFALAGLRTIVELALRMGGVEESRVERIVADIPAQMTSVLDRLDMAPDVRGYVCCAKCFACYDIDDYPDRCTMQNSRAGPTCHALLRKMVRRRGGREIAPVRKYLHHDMRRWMARLLCRPDLERWLDRTVVDPNTIEVECERMRDIWDGSILKQFKGPDGKHFILGKSKPSEGRYVFSLCMDGFNPYHNKQAGKKVTVGAMYMVCLNLPPHLRYRIENVFLVGIIPGPSSPSTSQINEVLKPLVQDLLAFWTTGIYFSRTFLYPRGRLIRCALVPLVCDLPAARQVAGFGSHNSERFCSFCRLHLHDMDELNTDLWGQRTLQEHLELATRWRDGTSEDRKKIFDEHYVRWSELLALPYWDPTRFVVLDSMHALLLGCIKRHLSDIWKMDSSLDETSVFPAYKGSQQPSEEQVQQAWWTMRHGSDEELARLRLSVIKVLADQLDCPKGKRNYLLQHLKAHVRKAIPRLVTCSLTTRIAQIS